MKDGDKNSNFFHTVIKERRRRNTIQLTLADGSSTSNARYIGEVAGQFFQNLYQSSAYHLDEDLFSVIDPWITNSRMRFSVLSPL